MTQRLCALVVLVILTFLGACDRSPVSGNGPRLTTANIPIEETKVRFANLPYADHTYSIIGQEKGFFRDVGIEITIDTIKIEDVVADLANGTYDVASVPPGILFSSHETAPELRTFVFGDLFQGYALMSTPKFTTYADFRSQGRSHEAALAATVGQLRGATFAYPTETAIKPFIDLLLQEGHMSRKDFTSLVLDDPLTINAMRAGRAQFQVGGVPSRITLQKEGFVPLVSSVDLARGAKPSENSPELQSILQNGWATTKAFYDGHRPTLLRLASVNYRIMKFMETHREEAMRLHMAYLTRVTGLEFSVPDAEIIYTDLDPFYTFERQHEWFHDKSSPLYYAYVNGAILRSFISDGIYKNKPPSIEDVIYADDVYRELERLRFDSSRLLEALKSIEPTLSQELRTKLKLSRQYFEFYDYYDSFHLAKEVDNAVGNAQTSRK